MIKYCDAVLRFILMYTYSNLFISEIKIFNLRFLTARHYFLREQECEDVWFVSKPKGFRKQKCMENAGVVT